jgi:hypothetical protein
MNLSYTILPKNIFFWCYPFVIFSVAFALNFQHPVAPSDPLQYLNHAVGLEQQANFLDRVVYLFTLRVFSDAFPFADATATLGYALTIAIVLFGVRLSCLLGCPREYSLLLALLLLSSHGLVAISAYGYPTQYQAAWVLLALTLLLDEDGPKYRYQFLGAVLVLAVFTKIQALLLVGLIFAIVIMRFDLSNIKRMFFGGIVGLAVLAVLDLIIVDIDVAAIFATYFESEIYVQMEGRNKGGVPPFFVLLLDPSYAFSVLGIWQACFGKATDRRLRLLGLMGLANFAFILFIYIVTQRGGPVILNYLLDTYAIGLICAVTYIARLLPAPSRTLWVVAFGLFTILVLIMPFFVQDVHTFLSDLDEDSWSLARYVLIGSVFWTLVAMFALKQRPLWLGVVLVLCLSYSSLGGIREAAFRKSFAVTFSSLVNLPTSELETVFCYDFDKNIEKFRNRLPSLSDYRNMRTGKISESVWPTCDEASHDSTRVRVWRDGAGFHFTREKGSI